MNQPDLTFWKRCSSCKKEIGFSALYYLCSVSTCRHARTGLRFCSVACWDAHLGYANHRGGAWAEEATSPKKEDYLKDLPGEPAREPVRKVVAPASASLKSTVYSSAARPSTATKEIETLVVVSKVKKLIADESDFNTSQCCIEALTQKVVDLCRQGIEKARTAGRKTVMGRDIR